MFVIQLFNNGSEVANAAHNTALVVHFKGQSSKFGAHSHLPGNGLYSICLLVVLMLPRSHNLLRLQYLPSCTKLYSLVLPLHAPSYDVIICTITVEAVVISKGGLYETSY